MRPRAKVKLSLIADPRSRRSCFKKRKIGLFKKLYELTTLCDVRACAIVNSSYEPNPAVWPSPEGVEEITSMFMALPTTKREKYMMNQETYLHKRIASVQERVKKLHTENQESQLRELMFDFIAGKMDTHQFDPMILQDLQCYINGYIDKLRLRIKHIIEYGESSSSIPLFPPAADPPLVADAVPLVVADTAAAPPIMADTAAAPFGFYDQYQYQNQHEPPVQYQALVDFSGQIQHVPPVQYHASVGFNDQIQHEPPVQYQAPIGFTGQIQHEPPVQYQAPIDFSGQIQHGINGMNLNVNLDSNYNDPSLNSNQYLSQQESLMKQMEEESQHGIHDMNSNQNMNHNLSLMNSNQYQYPYPNQQEPVMNTLVEHPQQMGYVGEHAHNPFMDGHYNYHQVPTADRLATTGLMPSFTTTTTPAAATVTVTSAGVYAPHYNNTTL